MLVRRSIPLLVLALAACYPRQPVAPPPAPEPEPPSVVSEMVAELERAERARVLGREGISLARQGRWAEAADRYRLAAELDPLEPRYPIALADALLQQGRAWEAADALQAGIRIEEARPTPNHRVLAVDYERLIDLLTRTSRLDEAREARERQAYHRRMRDAQVP